ncbi:hypothetical protein [Hymenobacter terricola]|uniref:hypothetical protein n=1 Tax=Hymenobacter terricola TaxID=2819236 RepID=UPI001B30B75E|nr:hypothetical protein [Hymenobacter terricola]
MKLLVRSLFATLVFLGVYYVWLRVLPGAVAVPQGINQDNVIKMQEYLYRTAGHCPTVILGSSLSAKLRPQALPPDVCNLALRGQSVFEGFELMRRAGQTPRLILLEMNVLDRAPSTGTIENLFSPTLHPLRRWYPGLQARHQPLNEALAGGLAILDRLRPAAAQRIEQKLGVGGPAPGDALPTDDANYQPPSPAVVAAARADYEQLPAQPAFGRNLALLHRYVRYFTARGSRVVFFEMPIDANACQGAKMRYIRQQLAADYPAGQPTYLPRPDCGAYRTTDGMHLTDPSAWRYSTVLAQELGALRNDQAVARTASLQLH